MDQESLLSGIQNGALLCRLANMVWEHPDKWRRTTIVDIKDIKPPKFKDNVESGALSTHAHSKQFKPASNPL